MLTKVISINTNIIDTMFSKPIFTTGIFSSMTNITNRKTANLILQKLAEKNVIVLIREAIGSKGNLYSFQELIDIIACDIEYFLRWLLR